MFPKFYEEKSGKKRFLRVSCSDGSQPKVRALEACWGKIEEKEEKGICSFFTFPFLPSNTGVGFQSTFPSSEKGKHGTGQRATSKGVPCQPLALKSSAKKYERRWMVPLQPTAVYQPAVSLLYCAHTAITTLSIISIFLVQFKLASVYICVFKASSCCSAVLII